MENNNTVDINDKLIDLELAKSTKNSKITRYYLPALVLIVSFYYSALLTLGLILGYVGSKVWFKYLLEKGRIDCIYIDCGKWKLHLHHWIMGILFLLLVWAIDYFYLPKIFMGVVIGIIAHDIYDFNDWHKILVKNEVKD